MLNNLPKITVITIALNLIKNNRADLFKECVKSVLNQTYKNIEYIIQDGESDDGTIDFIRNCNKNNVFKFYSQKDNGIDEAYNNALSHASGKYVIFMNSDDCFYNDTVVEECVEKLEQEKADYCYGKEKKVYRNGNFCMIYNPKIENFWKNMPFSHQTLFVKREVMEKLGGYNTDCGFGGDIHLVLQLILNDYKGIEIDKIISLYRIGGISSQTEDKKGQMKVLYVIAKRFLNLYKNFYDDISLEQVEDIYHFGDYQSVYPKYFLQKLIKFMIDKNLKNFDYNKFINYVNQISVNNFTRKVKVCYRLFDLLPFLKIKIKNNKKVYKLFGFLPIISIKEI